MTSGIAAKNNPIFVNSTNNHDDSKYSADFIASFGSITEDDLTRPEQGDFSADIKREEFPG